LHVRNTTSALLRHRNFRRKIEMIRLTKEEILEHYERQREPKLFIQFDGKDLREGGGDSSRPDDGLGIEKRCTYELMKGADVSILINPKILKETALTLLNKIIKEIETDNLIFKTAKDELKQCEEIKEFFTSLQKEYPVNDLQYLVDLIKENKKQYVFDCREIF
jgi:hypothetical protein